MYIAVLPPEMRLKLLCTSYSDTGSSAAVGSSSTMKGAFLYSARASVIFYASPPEISTPSLEYSL